MTYFWKYIRRLAIYASFSTRLIFRRIRKTKSLNFPRYNENDLFQIKKITAIKMKQFRFLLDILSIFPAKEVAYYMNFYDDERVGTIFLLNRVFKVHVVFQAVNNLEQSLNVNIKIIRMAKYLLCLVFGSYWIGVIIFMQACFYEVCKERSWYDAIPAESNLKDTSVFLLSFYYALQVLSQTGYGDLSPGTINEIITMFFFLVR